MKTKKPSVHRKPRGKRKKPLSSARQKSVQIENKPAGLREAEEKKLLSVTRHKLPELKVLLASASDHWGYEDPIYRFYHASFKVVRAQTTILKIVETLKSLAPHLNLNPDFLQIMAEGTAKTPSSPRTIIEAFFHARHMLLMLCKYADELSEPPSALPSGWATVLYLYNIR